MKGKLTIIKLGGSLLTEKQTPYTLRSETLLSVVKEIKQCLDLGLIDDLIIVHGVGSFGHPPVLEYRLHKGFQTEDQLINLSKTQQIVNDFRDIIVGEFIKVGIPINLFHASSLSVSEGMKINHIFLDSMKGYLSHGMVPLIGGDMIFDVKMGWSVGSGDQIAAVIAQKFNAENLIFVSDVPGVYNSDPKTTSDARLLKVVDLENLNKIIQEMGRSNSNDASGKMIGKLRIIETLKDSIISGLKISLITMEKPGNLLDFLKNQLELFTKIAVD